MSVLDIVHYGDPILKNPCKPFDSFPNIDTILKNMFDSMYEADGIGLAANQVGLDMQLFIVDITHTDEAEDVHVFINSSIVRSYDDEELFQEGCLSLPGIALDILRPKNVILKYQTPDQKWHEDKFEGLLARAIQHETDHLNGVFIIDRVSKQEKDKYKNDLKSLASKSKKKMAESLINKGLFL